MNAMLKKDIATAMKIRADFDAAEAANDKEGMDAARQAHREQKDQISACGRGYCQVFSMAMDAAERGNENIDIDDCLFDKDVELLMDSFRGAGITRFTFSSTWSSAVEIAWQFTRYGFQLKGITEINGCSKDFDTNQYEKVHAFIFEM